MRATSRMRSAWPLVAAILVVTAHAQAQGTRQAYIQSNPSGATILLDGTPIGETPMLVGLPLGRHAVRVEREGYVARARNIDLPPGSRFTLSFEMPPRGPSTLTIRFPSGVPPRLEVRIDGAALAAGRWVATSRLVRFAVPPGRHAVELRSMGHGLQLSIEAPEAASELNEEVTDFLARARPLGPEPDPTRAPPFARPEPAALAAEPATPIPSPAATARPEATPSDEPTLGILVSAPEPIAVELDAAARAACAAVGFRLAPSDALRAAVHFTAPAGELSDAQAQSLLSPMQLDALLMLTADESTPGTLFVRARVARGHAVTTQFGEVTRGAFAQWIARVAREIRSGSSAPATSASAAAPSTSGGAALAPDPSGAPDGPLDPNDIQQLLLPQAHAQPSPAESPSVPTSEELSARPREALEAAATVNVAAAGSSSGAPVRAAVPRAGVASLTALGVASQPLPRQRARSEIASSFDDAHAGLQILLSPGLGLWNDESNGLFTDLAPCSGGVCASVPFDVFNSGLSMRVLVEYRPLSFLSIGAAAQLDAASHANNTESLWDFIFQGMAWSTAAMVHLHGGENLNSGGDPLKWLRTLRNRSSWDISLGIGLGYGQFIQEFRMAGMQWRRDVEALVVPVEFSFTGWIGGSFGIGPFVGADYWITQSEDRCTGAGDCFAVAPRTNEERLGDAIWYRFGLQIGGRY